MPIIRVELFPGRSPAQKSALARSLTEGFVASSGGKPEQVHVIIEEIAPDNWAVAGELVSARLARGT